MKSNNGEKQQLSRFNGRELVRLCNDKLICAARDLAEFTKNGINASFIVALAHKCEHLEDSLNPASPQPNQSQPLATESEIKDAVDRICELGRRIWSNDPNKYSDYVIKLPAHHGQRDTLRRRR